MIVQMSKYAFMVYYKEYDSFLLTLRDLGVVHIRETHPAITDEHLQEILDFRKKLNLLLRDLKKSLPKDVLLTPAKTLLKEECLALITRIEELNRQKMQLSASLQAIGKDLDYLSIWGDFSYKTIQNLRKAGYEVSFYTIPASKYNPEWNEQYNAFLVNTYQSVSYFVTVTKAGIPVEIEAEKAKMPEKDKVGLKLLQEEFQIKMEKSNEELLQIVVNNYNSLLLFDKELQDEFNLKSVSAQSEKCADDKLMLLEGWVPTVEIPAMETALEKQRYYFQQLPVKEEDNIPIKLENNAFIRLFEPITRMYSLPNYREFDPTPFFAPFFMLFFGLCFGDGGYGLLMVIACTLLKKKVATEMKPVLTLFQYFGLTAIVVGICTGSFFGIALAEVPALMKIKNYFVSSDNLMTFSIVIGLVQIIFGKIVAAFKIKMQQGVKYSIAPFAWVFVITALVMVWGLPMLNVKLPAILTTILYGVAGAGLLVAYLYNSPGKNVFLNFGSGLWNTYNVASGLLGDTLSYIRLFAIGLTGAILGGVFNTLAISMTEGMNIVARVIVMLLILLVGHAINISLCTISSLVHPLRLIFVEYYKNSEFEGGGKAYEPFKKA